MAAPIDPTPYLSHRPVTAPTHKCSVFLFGHLFSYKNCGGRRDVITKSEAPKEKSEEAEGKTMVKTPFLQSKLTCFLIFQEYYNTALGILWGSYFAPSFFFSPCQDLVRRKSTSMKLLL